MTEGLVLSDDQMQESKTILGRIAKSLDAAASQAVPSCEPFPSESLLTGWQLGDVTLGLGAVQPIYNPQPSDWHQRIPDPLMNFRVGAYADVTVRVPGVQETARSLWYSDAHGPFQWCEVAVVFKPNLAVVPYTEAREHNTLPPEEAYNALSKMGANGIGPMQAVSIHDDGSVKGGKSALEPINEQEFVERWANLFKDAVQLAKG